jgi:hypothetical protein
MHRKFRSLALAAALLMGSHAQAAEPLLGVFGENSMAHVLEFEKWLGRPVDEILCTVDFEKWENYRYANWLTQTVYGNRGPRRLGYDVPIIIKGATYAEAKTGAYDDHWQTLAKSILENNPGTFEIVIRVSHEMNGEWFVWGVGGGKQAQIPDFIASWKRFHGVWRGVPGGERFRFSWCPSEGASDPRPMWPGDAYVDIVACDVYWKPKAMGGEGYETNDPQEAWQQRVKNGYTEWGVGGMLDFARAHKKPFQIDEWGVTGPDAAAFVNGMAEFLRANGARSHTYWNSKWGGYPGELDKHDADWPATAAAFKAQFGKGRAK